MIPILYTADETRFVTNGIGRLSDCTRAVVTEERNGVYELEFDVPITGMHFDEIQLGRIVACTHDDQHDIQPFVIYQKSIPDLNGIVTFNAHHISYRLCDIAVMPYKAGSVAAALRGITNNSVNQNPFTFWTDKTTTAQFVNDTPRNARNMLGGEENSILDVFGGGDYEFDKFTVKLHADRGIDSDVEIRYSKNLVSLSQQIDDSGSYNGVVPYWTDGESIVTLPEKMLVFSGAEKKNAYLTDDDLIIIRTETNDPIEVVYSVVDAVPMDLSDAFEDKPTVSQLRQTATSRFQNSGAWLPSENLEIDFVQLWQTEEFKEYSALQRVRLCDTVSVYYPQGGIAKVKQKVVRVVYNVLLDRYDSIELGQVQTSLGQAIREDVMQEVPTTSMMQRAIRYASDMIRGGLGGYVVMTPGEDGYPQEILIMDTPDVNTAVNVWRFNQGGLGHSSNGYNGPFSDIALTQDGKINASMITAGIMNANLIRAGIISDGSGLNSWDLGSGQLVTKQGTIGGFTLNGTGLTYSSSSRLLSFDSSNGLIATGRYYYTSEPNVYYTSGVVIKDEEMRFVGKRNSSNVRDYSTVAKFEIGYENSGAPWLNLLQSDGNVFLSFFNEDYISCSCDFRVYGDMLVTGTKPRDVKTKNYGNRLLYCYETPTPLFGDIGETRIDSDGLAYVEIDDIFSETIAEKVEYQVFLQKEGEGDCWIAEKNPRYFVIQGTPNLKVSWELKAKQRDYELTRLERDVSKLDTYEHVNDVDIYETYISSQEELLYGYY